MSWFFIALIGPVLYALANHTDKFLISKYLKNGEVGSLIIFASIFSVVALPIVYLIHPESVSVGGRQAFFLALNGTTIVFAVLLYFYALHEDEPSFVVPFYQTIPVFAYLLGYVVLGETITVRQAQASLLILAGALFLSFAFDGKKIRFKKKVVLLMLGASLLYAINGVAFKYLALDEGFWPSVFWGFVGKLLVGLAFLAFIPSYRSQFLAMMGQNRNVVLGLNTLSETLLIVAEGVTQYATLLAPVALVLLVNSFQPLFVLVIGVLLTLFFPKIGLETITRQAITQKLIGIVCIGVGALLLG